MHIKPVFERTSRRERTRMTEKVAVTEKSHERALSYGMKQNDGKLRRSDKRRTRTKRGVLYVVCEAVAVITNEKARDANFSVGRCSTDSFAPGLTEICKVSTMKVY